MNNRVGVDCGGTFTDLVYMDETGGMKVVKTSSTPRDPSLAIEEGIKKSGIDLGTVSFFSHGATVGINTVIQNKGVRTAIVTTKGFRDIIELRRGQRVIDRPIDMYNLQMDIPQDYVGGYSPLVERPYRFEIPERIDYKGDVVIELDEDAVRKVAEELRRRDVEAVAVCYYFSFVNPEHEQRSKKILEAMLPDVRISLSSEILPVIREYERLSTTTINAYIMPIMKAYLMNLRNKLTELGFKKEYYIMQSGGGIMSSELAGDRPVYTIDSGPAAGVSAAAELGMKLGFPDIISFDMGGTTAKVCVVVGGKPQITNNFWIDGKYFIGAPVMDMVEIGAGGGSMAWIDSAGAVHVGPQSAGADPGPVCYKRGGTEPTVTDADLVLGYINADYFLGGDMTVDVDASRAAIKEKIADRLGMGVAEAANGIYRMINANMLGAMRIVTVQRGYDPRDFSLLLSGGTAAIHAVRMAQDLRIPRVIIPLAPGTFSAYGLITADARYDAYRSYVSRTSNADPVIIQGIYRDLKEEGTSRIKELGFSDNDILVNYSIDMRYSGQAHEVALEIPAEMIENRTDKNSIEKLEEMFHQRHKYLFGHSSPGAAVELITLSVTAIGPTEKGEMPEIDEGPENPDAAYKGLRKVFFEDYADYKECRTYDRYRLKANNHIQGPAIIEQMDTTIVIPPDQDAKVDKFGNIIINIIS
ncbi:MAG: hydantoinase/oxoprolinase family protein [Deltaproteobacteria bacterium]|nr:hydantoinase/oxoprolinase family protein [Deltaproteobacteria bacterium]